MEVLLLQRKLFLVCAFLYIWPCLRNERDEEMRRQPIFQWTGFKFSRASYVLSLLRPQIVDELDLKSFGLKVYLRGYSSFTPMIDGSNYLLLGKDPAKNFEEISKFSKKDAEQYGKYEEMLEKFGPLSLKFSRSFLEENIHEYTFSLPILKERPLIPSWIPLPST